MLGNAGVIERWPMGSRAIGSRSRARSGHGGHVGRPIARSPMRCGAADGTSAPRAGGHPNMPEAAALLDAPEAATRTTCAPGRAVARARRQGGADEGRPRSAGRRASISWSRRSRASGWRRRASRPATPTAPAARSPPPSPPASPRGGSYSPRCAMPRTTSPARSPPPIGWTWGETTKADMIAGTARYITFTRGGERAAKAKKAQWRPRRRHAQCDGGRNVAPQAGLHAEDLGQERYRGGPSVFS